MSQVTMVMAEGLP